VLPAGTCNDFARYLGLRARRMEHAFRIACGGKAQSTDLGLMGNELYLNNAGFGRRPISPTAPKRWRSFRALRTFRPTALRATWDKGSLQGTFYMGLACNAPYFSGGLHFSKFANPRDGVLDVYFMPAMAKWKLLPILALGRLGRPARFK